jgi:hypothetical protein
MIKPGPKTTPLPDDARALLIHWGYTDKLTYEEMAVRIKISSQTLGGILRGKRGMKAETERRVMRFVRRLQKKGINPHIQGKEATMRNPPESIPE